MARVGRRGPVLFPCHAAMSLLFSSFPSLMEGEGEPEGGHAPYNVQCSCTTGSGKRKIIQISFFRVFFSNEQMGGNLTRIATKLPICV